jgi:hypothetical protein
MRLVLPTALVLATAVWAAPAMADRDPTPEERTQIEAALRAEGFTQWDDIEHDDDHWEVDDAVAADGQRYDLKLDMNLAIIERELD